MNEERHGLEALRESIETVASDVERRARGRPARRPRRGGRVVAWSLAAVVAAAALGIWLTRPRPTPEVQILELKIQGRPVRAVVVESRESGTLYVLPGPEEVSETPPAAGVEVALVVGERR